MKCRDQRHRQTIQGEGSKYSLAPKVRVDEGWAEPKDRSTGRHREVRGLASAARGHHESADPWRPGRKVTTTGERPFRTATHEFRCRAGAPEVCPQLAGQNVHMPSVFRQRGDVISDERFCDGWVGANEHDR